MVHTTEDTSLGYRIASYMLNLMTSPSNSMVRDPSSTSIFVFAVFKNGRPRSTDEALGNDSSFISTT
ncbi:hypothetical protein Syun_025783 [Stephania yunnanensis]|uniref:Uncharacterized protein n=1 Tax=Stephania yunnanensis TaxID=152371 RepID=A0AAP0EZF7_9MAGN